MPTLLMFAIAREASGLSHDTFEATTVGELLDLARSRYGQRFAQVLESSRVWVNGEEMSSPDLVLHPDDEVAVIPPVAGG